MAALGGDSVQHDKSLRHIQSIIYAVRALFFRLNHSVDTIVVGFSRSLEGSTANRALVR